MIPHAVIADILKAVEPLIDLTKWRNLRRDWPADGPWKVSITNAQVWELHDAFAALSALAPEGERLTAAVNDYSERLGKRNIEVEDLRANAVEADEATAKILLIAQDLRDGLALRDAQLAELRSEVATEKKIANGWAECASHECGNCVFCLRAQLARLREELFASQKANGEMAGEWAKAQDDLALRDAQLARLVRTVATLAHEVDWTSIDTQSPPPARSPASSGG